MSDLQFDPMNDTPPTPESPQETTRSRPAIAWIAIPVAAVIGLCLLFFLRSKPVAPPTAAPARAEAVPAAAETPRLSAPPVPAPADRTLPLLAESDGFVRSLATELFASAALDGWLAAGDELVARGAGAVLAVAEKRSPRRFLDFLPFEGRFAVADGKARGPIAPESFRRYDRLVGLFCALDPKATARFIAILEPLLAQALDESAFPGTGFGETLATAVEHLLSTPLPGTSPEVYAGEDGVHRFTDPMLEALSAPQKQLLRMGPEHGARVRSSLAALLEALRPPDR